MQSWNRNIEHVAPKIADDDIHWASDLLELPPAAFFGEDGSDPRQHIIKSMDSVDVAACPGSGKTTLLVAKLAIIARNWQCRTRGLCVLSHTNAARKEIESRLGNTTTGRRLLSYPHYVGTIHGFVNEFLAIPWLRSKGYPIKMIETGVCQRRRWKMLPYAIQTALEKNRHRPSVLSIKSPDFSVGDIRWGKGILGRNAPTYVQIQDACRQSTHEGYFCYDEMFMWAEDLLAEVPTVVQSLRGRFPILFIDEAQDNSEIQSAILHRVFLKGTSRVIRQRLGDGNQAIFDFNGAEEATTDRYPIAAIVKELPNSHRFGPDIARIADPLGLDPYPSGLKGQGPRTPLSSGLSRGCHTIFLFDGESVSKVLDAYAELLIETFSERELLCGTFTAVGQRHTHPSQEECKECLHDKCQKFPHHVGHYWPCYAPELTSREPRPHTFAQYVFAGIEKAKTSGEVYQAVEKISEGLLRLAGMAKSGMTMGRRMRNHQYVLQLLQQSAAARNCYKIMVVRFAVKQKLPTGETWGKRWRDVVRMIAEAIAGTSLSGQEVEQFLMWKDNFNGSTVGSDSLTGRNNVYMYPSEDPKVQIHVGSIHSIKGETHTGTLVLDTFWQGHGGRHNLELILPWLIGEKHGRSNVGKQQQYRLKTHYVGFTRPTHLLCLAMKRSSLHDGNGSLEQEKVQKLKSHGWNIREV